MSDWLPFLIVLGALLAIGIYGGYRTWKSAHEEFGDDSDQ